MPDIQHSDAARYPDDVFKQAGLVLVDFWASWCGPCKALAPTLEEVARTQPQVRVIKVDSDANKELAVSLQVRGLPTLILYKNGQELRRLTGAVSRSRIVDMIEDAGEDA